MAWEESFHWLETAASLLYPHVCDLCGSGRATHRESFLCHHCRTAPGHLREVGEVRCRRCGLPREGAITGEFQCSNCEGLELGFDRAIAAVVATPFLLDIVHRYKYRRALWYEGFLAELLVGVASRVLVGERWDAVVPVPLHRVREREREFNQSERLARRMASALGLPLRTDLVERRSETRTQALLDRSERAKNVAGAFSRRSSLPLRLDGWRVVVVDDVLTTGATTSAVGWVLRDAGAAEVTVLTVARGI